MAKMNSMPVEQQETLTLNPRLGRPPSSKRTLVRVAGLPVAGRGLQVPPWLSTREDWAAWSQAQGHFFQICCPTSARHQQPQRCEVQLVVDDLLCKQGGRTQAWPSSKAVLGLDFSLLLQVDFSLPQGAGMDSVTPG